MTLGKTIKDLREKQGYTQRELADKLNIGNSTLAMYEIDKREPDNATLGRLADFFSVTTDYLLGRTNDLCIALTPQKEQQVKIAPDDLELLRQIKNLPETDRKEIESYIQYKKHLNNEHAATKVTGN